MKLPFVYHHFQRRCLVFLFIPVICLTVLIGCTSVNDVTGFQTVSVDELNSMKQHYRPESKEPGQNGTSDSKDGLSEEGTLVLELPASDRQGETDVRTDSFEGTVYWTPGGQTYHYYRDCSYLKQSSQIESGSVTDASKSVKRKPCSRCTNRYGTGSGENPAYATETLVLDD